MLSNQKVRLLITSRYIAMQSYECVIISKMFLIYFIYYGCNDSALVFLGGAEASASPSFALPMFITIKKIIILHLFLHPGTPVATPLSQDISETQSGFNKGRLIHNNIRLVLDLIDYGHLIKDDGFVLFLDFYKAFDTVEHEFILHAIKCFGPN